MAEQTTELVKNKLTVPMMAWGGKVSFGSHCYYCVRVISTSVRGGVIEECGQIRV
jgi:hypothetical protein